MINVEFFLCKKNSTRPYLKSQPSREQVEVLRGINGSQVVLNIWDLTNDRVSDSPDGELIYTTLGKSLSDIFIYEKWLTFYKARKEIMGQYSKKPIVSRHDNRRVETSLRDGAATTIVRFPRKSRSKKTWKNFWKAFPAFDGFYTLEEWKKNQNKTK